MLVYVQRNLKPRICKNWSKAGVYKNDKKKKKWMGFLSVILKKQKLLSKMKPEKYNPDKKKEVCSKSVRILDLEYLLAISAVALVSGVFGVD